MLVGSELHDEMENIVLDSKLIDAINNASKVTTSELEGRNKPTYWIVHATFVTAAMIFITCSK